MAASSQTHPNKAAPAKQPRPPRTMAAPVQKRGSLKQLHAKLPKGPKRQPHGAGVGGRMPSLGRWPSIATLTALPWPALSSLLESPPMGGTKGSPLGWIVTCPEPTTTGPRSVAAEGTSAGGMAWRHTTDSYIEPGLGAGGSWSRGSPCTANPEGSQKLLCQELPLLPRSMKGGRC